MEPTTPRWSQETAEISISASYSQKSAAQSICGQSLILLLFQRELWQSISHINLLAFLPNAPAICEMGKKMWVLVCLASLTFKHTLGEQPWWQQVEHIWLANFCEKNHSIPTTSQMFRFWTKRKIDSTENFLWMLKFRNGWMTDGEVILPYTKKSRGWFKRS